MVVMVMVMVMMDHVAVDSLRLLSLLLEELLNSYEPLTLLLEVCSLLLTKLLKLLLNLLLDRREPMIDGCELPTDGRELLIDGANKSNAESSDRGVVVLRHGSCDWYVMRTRKQDATQQVAEHVTAFTYVCLFTQP